MLGFLVALFGGVYYGGKWLYKKGCDIERENQNKIHEVCTPPYEVLKSANEFFSNTKDVMKAIETIMPDLQFIFGDKLKDVLESVKLRRYITRPRFNSVNGFGCTDNIIYQLWLTKQGYTEQPWRPINPYFGIYRIPDEDRAKIAIKTCFVMERNMQRAHPEYAHCFRLVRPLYSNLDPGHYLRHQLSWAYTKSGTPTEALWKVLPDGSYRFNFGITSDEHPDYETVWVN